MKKIVFLCLMALAMVGMNSCKVETQCDCKTQFHKQTVDLKVREWQYDNQLNTYYCRFDVPEITKDVYNYGEWSINRDYGDYQVVLPETSYKSQNVNGQTFFYEQHIDYAVGVEFVEIMYTISDFEYPEGDTPDKMLFRLQLTY